MLAIAGGKGGCGKTTTTLGLATDLARAGRRVLAVDADRGMPDLHAVAGVEGEPTVAALADSSEGSAGIAEVASPIPGHPGGAVVPSAPGVDREQLRRGLRRIARGAPGPVLVDCPAGAGPGAVDPLRVADRTLVVTTASPASLRDAAKTAALARAVGTDVVGGVVTRAECVPDGLERLLDAPVTPVPSRDTPVSDSAVRRARKRVIESLFPPV